MERRAALFCAWCAPALILLIGTGLVACAGMVPPTSPSESPQEIADFYVEGQDEIRIGMVLIMIGGAGFIPWAIGLANALGRTVRPPAALTQIQVVTGVIAALVAISFSMIGSLAAFRPGELAPETTRLLNDLLWFWWLIPWPPFTVWCAIVGIVILSDRGASPTFPRWTGYLSIWAAVCYAPGSLAIFFTEGGAFAYNGLVTWYIPTVVFFIWVAVMTPLMIREAKHGRPAAA